MEKLVLIDGNSLLNRAFFATPAFSTKDGLPTNGIYGFIKLFLKIADELKPEYMVVAFDMHAPTFRHKMYDGYKATRKGMPDELAVQMPVLKECLALMNVKMCFMEGVEADDIIGTLSRKFEDVESYIYTGDRDSYQLVKENVNVYYTRKGVSDILKLTNENFFENIALMPKQIIDLKSLMGDSSDNIPGVPGIGEKTARTLLEKYSSLEGVYEHLDELKGATLAKLQSNKELAFLSKTLATIDTNVALDVELEDCRLIRPFSLEAKSKFAALEFRTMYADSKLFTLETIKNEPNKTERDIEIEQIEVRSAKQFVENFKAKELSVILSDNCQAIVYADGKEYTFAEMVDLFTPGISVEEKTEILKFLFEQDRKIVVFGAKNILYKLEEYGISVKADLEDVDLLKYLVDFTGKEESLDFVLDSYGLLLKNKGYSLFKLYGILLQKVKDENMISLYSDIEKPLTYVLYDMEKEGISIQEEALAVLGETYTKQLKALSDEIHALAYDDSFNINSTKQLSEILFGKLALPGGKKNKNGSYSSSADILEKLAPEHEIVRKILEYRKIQKLNSTYVEGLKPFIKEGKIHTTFTQTVTSTGRLSSKNPNIQNIPVRTEEGKEIRKLFKASENNVLIDADYSQIELRLMAHMANCKELIEAYQSGKDIHTDTAAKVYGVAYENVTSSMRRNAKAVNFGIIYGESAFGLSQNLNISAGEAAAFIKKYFEAFPAVKEYQNNTVAFAKEKGYVLTLFGRKREIVELKSSNFNVRAFGERAAMNMPLQGTSADIIKKAMVDVHRELKNRGLKSKLIMQVHDELILDCPENETEETKEILVSCMENVIKLSVPLTVEAAIGKDWYEAK